MFNHLRVDVAFLSPSLAKLQRERHSNFAFWTVESLLGLSLVSLIDAEFSYCRVSSVMENFPVSWPTFAVPHLDSLLLAAAESSVASWFAVQRHKSCVLRNWRKKWQVLGMIPCRKRHYFLAGSAKRAETTCWTLVAIYPRKRDPMLTDKMWTDSDIYLSDTLKRKVLSL